MTEDEYDDTYTDENQDVVYGVFWGETLIATTSLLHGVRAYSVTFNRLFLEKMGMTPGEYRKL